LGLNAKSMSVADVAGLDRFGSRLERIGDFGIN